MTMMKTGIKVFLFLMVTCHYVQAQLPQYANKRDIYNLSGQWNRIELPDDVFSQVKNDMSDIRIYGTTTTDTIEVPYILKKTDTKTEYKKINHKIINKGVSFTSVNGVETIEHSYTFKNTLDEVVNEMLLNFELENFDCEITLEGSHDQQKWFTILDHYRILSIKNSMVDFSFTKLRFHDSNYPYFRIVIQNKENPRLVTAELLHKTIIEGKYKQYVASAVDVTNDKDKKQTFVTIHLETGAPLCELTLHVRDTLDYCRSMTVKYANDSIKTENGTRYDFRVAGKRILNSIDTNSTVFNFNNAGISKIIQITIDNQDNRPLTIDSVSLAGYIYELIGRFDEAAMSYALYYGNKKALAPDYDITHFQDKIPTEINEAKPGKRIRIDVPKDEEVKPLIENKLWLWCLIILIIITLGWFSLKMLKNSDNHEPKTENSDS